MAATQSVLRCLAPSARATTLATCPCCITVRIMQVVYTLCDARVDRDVVLTIGTFDGVHLGHKDLIVHLVHRAAETHRVSAVLTFDPHPRAVLHPEEAPAYLSSPGERIATMESLGLDLLVVLPFTRSTADNSARDFMQRLVRQLRVRELWVGDGFVLGRDREGDTMSLRELGTRLGYSMRVVEPVRIDGLAISSTRIRKLISRGRVADAARLLGRHYALTGKVVHGSGRGRGLGLRTANLQVPPNRAMPSHGVYAVWATTRGDIHRAVVNVGTRPSFDNGKRSVEVHILDFGADLYDDELRIEFVRYLRAERRFKTAAALVAQVRCDIVEARAALDSENDSLLEQASG